MSNIKTKPVFDAIQKTHSGLEKVKPRIHRTEYLDQNKSVRKIILYNDQYLHRSIGIWKRKKKRCW